MPLTAKMLLFVLLTGLLACTRAREGIVPKTTPIAESVYASVTVQPDSLYQAYATVSGIVDRVVVHEGDQVKAGDPILMIRDEDAGIRLANARLAYEQARNNLKGENNALVDLENRIGRVELQLKDDSINYVRQKTLWARNIGTRVEFEHKQLAYQLSVRELENLKSAYRKQKQDLEIKFQEAANQYRLARINQKDYTVCAKIEGTVYALEKEPGEKVTIQEPVASLGSTGRFVIDMRVDERDIARIRLQQRVYLSLEAYKDRVFEGKVSKIYPQKNERNQTFRVEAEFEPPLPEVLYAGLSGEANILIGKKERALTIPADYLLEPGLVLTDAGEVSVETGFRSLELVEIRSGIDSTTTIYPPE